MLEPWPILRGISASYRDIKNQINQTYILIALFCEFKHSCIIQLNSQGTDISITSFLTSGVSKKELLRNRNEFLLAFFMFYRMQIV